MNLMGLCQQGYVPVRGSGEGVEGEIYCLFQLVETLSFPWLMVPSSIFEVPTSASIAQSPPQDP